LESGFTISGIAKRHSQQSRQGARPKTFSTQSVRSRHRPANGIIETARAFIVQNNGRLAKVMKPMGAQAGEPGDIVALSFATPDEEAQYIATTALALRGVAFNEDDIERGLWIGVSTASDIVPIMAVHKCTHKGGHRALILISC
jgi:hypothetical protein